MRKECTLVLFDDDGNVIPNYTTKSPNDVIKNQNDTIDLISRADTVKELGEYRVNMLNHFEMNYRAEANRVEECINIINALPSADRPQGEWIKQGNTLICPICGAKGEEIKDDYCFNYCPVCGADMRGDTE